MGERKMNEQENEVFIYEKGDTKMLVIVGKDDDMFQLEAKDFLGKRPERDMESIGIFRVYD